MVVFEVFVVVGFALFAVRIVVGVAVRIVVGVLFIMVGFEVLFVSQINKYICHKL
jgi:ABC-type lipoprotein release transport system permease subunit